jgi:hypothetical protein
MPVWNTYIDWSGSVRRRWLCPDCFEWVLEYEAHHCVPGSIPALLPDGPRMQLREDCAGGSVRDDG